MKKDISIFLFFLGLLLFSWPFINIFHESLTTYLFVVWILFIAMILAATVFGDREGGGN
ncbi:MAG: hypothetical protein OEW15_07155 [Nitrospirota bacterium]|nr:hypothetical protein [Nitrospirota bacterium]